MVWVAAAMLLLLMAGCGSAASGEAEIRESQVQESLTAGETEIRDSEAQESLAAGETETQEMSSDGAKESRDGEDESQTTEQESDLAEGQRRAQIQVVSITGNKLTYREEDQEEQTVYLPVGVIVHTPSGKETTFMILEEEDELEALFQENEDGEEVITEIWMS